MANIARTVEILFSAKDQMSMKLTGINQALELLEKTVNALLDPLAQLGDAIIEVDKVIAGYARTLGSDVLDASMDLESVLIDLKRLLGEQTEQFDDLVEASRELSREFGVALEDVIQSVIEFKRANFDAKESLDLTREALTLVRVGFVDMHTATESLVKILKGFGAEADKANEIVDILSITSNTYATNVEKLAIGMGELAPIASKVGFSMAETAGLATKVIEVFQSGEEAATALKTGFTRLATGSAQVQKAYDKLKISGKDANGMLKDGKTMLGEIAAAMGKFTEAEQVQISAWLVGNRQAQKMVDIFTDYDKVIKIGIKALSDRQYAEKQLVEVMKATKFQLEKMETGWIELKAAMGDEFLPVLSLILQGLHEIETALTDTVNEGVLKDIADRLLKYGDEIKKYLQGIATAIPEALKGVDVGPLLDSWDNVASTLSKVFDTAKIENAEDLAEKVQVLVNAMTLLVNITNGMIKPWTDLTNKLLETIPILAEVEGEVATSFGNILGHVQMIKKMGFIWYGVYRAMGNDVETFQDRAVLVADKIAKKQAEEKIHLLKKQEAWDSVLSYIEGRLYNLTLGLDDSSKRTYEWTLRHRESLKKLEEAEKKFTETFVGNKGEYTKALEEQRKANEETEKSFGTLIKEGEEYSLTIEELASEINDLPQLAEIDIKTKTPIPELNEELIEYGITIKELPDGKVIVVTTELEPEADWNKVDAIWNARRAAMNTSIDLTFEIDTHTLDRVVTSANKAINEGIPTEKSVKILLDGIDVFYDALDKIQYELEEVEPTKEVEARLTEVKAFREKLNSMVKLLDEAPSAHNVKFVLDGITKALKDIETLQEKLDATPKNVKIDVEVDGVEEAIASFDGLHVKIGETPEEVEVKVKVDEKSFEAVTKRIDALAKHANEKLKLEATINVAEIEAAASAMVASIEAEANKAIAVINSLASSIAAVSNNVGGMFSSLVGLYDRIIDLGEEQIQIMEETAQSFEDLKSEIEETISALDDYLEKMEEITDAIDDQEDSVDELERELAQYEKALKRIEDGISTEQIEKDLERIRNEIKEVERELDYLYSQPYSPENEAKIKKLERELEYLKREEDILNKTMEDSAAAREEFERKILDLKKEIWEAQKEINDLAGDLPDVIGDASKEWDEWMGKIGDAKERLRELYDMGLISKAEFDLAMKYLNELEQKVTGFLDELEAMGIEDVEEIQRETGEKQLRAIEALKAEIRAQTATLEAYLDEQMALQSQLIHKQMELVDAQIEQIEARTAMMKKGDSMIKIQGDGLEPELEAFMWKILENLQVRANQEFSEFLIGLRGLNLTSTTGSL